MSANKVISIDPMKIFFRILMLLSYAIILQLGQFKSYNILIDCCNLFHVSDLLNEFTIKSFYVSFTTFFYLYAIAFFMWVILPDFSVDQWTDFRSFHYLKNINYTFTINAKNESECFFGLNKVYPLKLRMLLSLVAIYSLTAVFFNCIFGN